MLNLANLALIQAVWDGMGELAFGLMFHGFDYPDETGENNLYARFWQQKMIDGIIQFERPKDCKIRKAIRAMSVKRSVLAKIFSQ